MYKVNMTKVTVLTSKKTEQSSISNRFDNNPYTGLISSFSASVFYYHKMYGVQVSLDSVSPVQTNL